MEFNEKLQELRKSKGLTQEELAEKLFISRTAISKWDSGRGYPSLDSLKEIARFFSVTIDDLICSDEMISVAENEKREFADKYVSLICSVMDILPIMLLFIPAFGNGTASPETVSLFGLTGIAPWLKTVFAVIIGITILNGICGADHRQFQQAGLEQAQACYRSRPVDTLGHGFYCDEAAICRDCLFRVSGHKGLPDSQSETTIEHGNQAVWHDYKNYFLRRVLFEKTQHTGDCGLTGRFGRNRTNLPLKGN